MGRKPYINSNLPKGLRARKRGKTIYYYYDTGTNPRREIALGKDYAIAVKKWSELEIDQEPQHQKIITFRYVAERYIKEVLRTKAPATQKDNLRELKQLYLFFDNPPAPLDEIRPVHVLKYMDYRAQQNAPVRAKREKALFSHIFNKAREWGYTDKSNPCAGIRGVSEKSRDVYITDEMYYLVYKHAEQPLKDAMDLAYLTAQRPADVLKMSDIDIQEGILNVTQNKTNKKLRINIEGELSKLIDRINSRKSSYKIRSFNLIVDKNGQRLTASALREQFDRAREKAGIDKSLFQFRDLRGKAATDKTENSGNIREAQKQLGHSTISMTEKYVKNRKGDKVTPTK